MKGHVVQPDPVDERPRLRGPGSSRLRRPGPTRRHRVTVTIPAGATPTFGIFLTGTGAPVPFDPATNRIFVRFNDAGGVTRGATSVAVRTQ